MRKIAIAAGVAALLCVGSVAMAEPAQVDYESMTLEEVKALADEANAYYKEQTTTGSEKAKEAKGLLSSALEEMYPRLTARLQPSWKNRKPRIRYTPCLRMRRG